MRSFASWIRVGIHWVWGLGNPSLGSPYHCLHYHSIFGDMIFLGCINIVSHHPCIFSLLSFIFDHLFSCWLFHIYSFLPLIHVFVLVASSYRLHRVEDLTTSLFSYSSSLTLPLFAIESVGSRDYPTHHILHTRVLGLIIGYLSLVSFHFFYPIT